jgi:hypothetical protein
MAPSLLTLRRATVRLGAEPLLEALTVAVAAADRICLVGRNGVGKIDPAQGARGAGRARRGRALPGAGYDGRLSAPGAKEFGGTLLLGSRDRDFLDRLVTSVIAFEGGGRLREYAGGYSDMVHQRAPETPQASKSRARSAERPETGAPRSCARAHRDLDRLLGRIDALGAAIARLEGDLADPDLFGRDPKLPSSPGWRWHWRSSGRPTDPRGTLRLGEPPRR